MKPARSRSRSLSSAAPRAPTNARGSRRRSREGAAILASTPKVIEFCEPCGDKAPGTRSRENRRGPRCRAAATRVVVNGHAVDLAYMYVKTVDTQYENLAQLAGCPATGVSPSLAIAAETPTAS